MSKVSFENYKHLALSKDVNNTTASGRYSFQAEAERRILFDLLGKLDLKVSDSLLEIGCGPGNLLVPLSGFCRTSAGIDNEVSLSRLKNRFDSETEIHCFPGDFLEMNLLETSFDKILIYGVINYLSNLQEVFVFITRALSLLTPGGRMLIGDLPNTSKKSRFLTSTEGKKISTEWGELVREAGDEHRIMQVDNELITFDDAVVLDLMAFIRNKGFDSFLLPQPIDLPFGGSREDILVVAYG